MAYGQTTTISDSGVRPRRELTNNFNSLLGNVLSMYPGGQSADVDGAVQTQRNLREELLPLLSQMGQGEATMINNQAQVAQNNLMGSLASRGLSGSNLSAIGASDIEQQRTNAFSDLQNQLLGRRVGAETGIADTISNVYANAGQGLSDLYRGLLGGAGTEAMGDTEQVSRMARIYTNNTLL